MDKERYELYRSLREQGKTYQEIADLVGVSRKCVQNYCKLHKELQYTEEERKQASVNRALKYLNQYEAKPDTYWKDKVLTKFGNSFALVNIGELNENGDRMIEVKCLTCGTIKAVSSISFRGECGKHGHCDICYGKARAYNKVLTERKETIEKERKQTRHRLKTKQVGFRFCECGAILAYQDRLCVECKEKHKQQTIKKQTYKQCKDIWYKAERKRAARLKGVKSDKDATLKAVYEKYNGVCYLCGELCDWNDSEWKNGVFYAHGRYPSREHIIALANGGDDTWSNLRLAHKSCNEAKGTKKLESILPLGVG